MRNFSIRLKELRSEKGISQAMLADAVNVGQSTIACWESDTCEPTASNLSAIADYFGVTTDFLLGRAEF